VEFVFENLVFAFQFNEMWPELPFQISSVGLVPQIRRGIVSLHDSHDLSMGSSRIGRSYLSDMCNEA